MTETKFRTEEFHIDGDLLVAKIKELLQQGNIRRVIIKNEDGRILIDIPLTAGVVVGLIAPQLAALAAVGVLVTKCTLVIEREEERPG